MVLGAISEISSFYMQGNVGGGRIPADKWCDKPSENKPS